MESRRLTEKSTMNHTRRGRFRPERRMCTGAEPGPSNLAEIDRVDWVQPFCAYGSLPKARLKR